MRREPGDRSAQVLLRCLLQRLGETATADGPVPLRRKQRRARQRPVVSKLAADLLDPPDQQRTSISEHRHKPLTWTRAPRALAHPHMDLPERAMREVEVIDCQPTQFTQSQPNLGGQSCHHVRPGCGQPFAMLGQLIPPGVKEGGQVLRRRWIRTLKSPAWRGRLHSSIGDVMTLPVSSWISPA